MSSFLELARARRGHFKMESGLHCGLWFDLDAAFVDQSALDPFVTQLAQSLRRHQIEAVCGPLTGGAIAGVVGDRPVFALLALTGVVIGIAVLRVAPSPTVRLDTRSSAR